MPVLWRIDPKTLAVSAHALALDAALPEATLMTLEGTGHELHRADWPAILDAVAAGLDLPILYPPIGVEGAREVIRAFRRS